MRKLATFAALLLTVGAMPAIAQDSPASTAHPASWPKTASRGLIDPATERQIDSLLAKMTLEEKVGQLIQGDISSVRPEDLKQYPLGSILAGGSSPPIGHPDRSPAAAWLETAHLFRDANRTKIPLLFGLDAVHGNNNIVGATLFPHNIGLGAARDPELLRRIGTATAAETAAAGWDWAFGPTLTVPQDIRWGRSYEGYSEDPAIVRMMAAPMVEGLQGKPGEGRIQTGHVAASAKHFLGDGGTHNGVDQGDTQVDEASLVSIHNAGYPDAIAAGTMSVMASFNSWNGEKMHGNRTLLTDVLKGRMGFAGLVVGDWNGHGQVKGCTNTDCPRTFNAGMDIAMAPDSWKGLFDSTLAAAKSGAIPMARIDDAVRRILRVKLRLGLFDAARPYEGRFDVVGAPAHRALAREAVRKSLVLLKNDGVLPVKPGARILVAGPGADDIGRQSGGWTLSWQGDGNERRDFPNAQTIWEGIAEAARANGSTAVRSADGRFTQKPDVAIVVFGELPYAEMRGDIRTLEFEPGDKQALDLLKRLKAAGVPTVSVFLSGRPMWVNPELNASDAFVAAWLPGSEGGGVADLLLAGKGTDFTGRLSFAWPANAGQFTRAQRAAAGLFPLGYGLSYARPGKVAQLPEEAGVDPALGNQGVFFARGRPPAPFSASFTGQGRPVDGPETQEGAIELTFPGVATVSGGPLDLSRETNADVVLRMTYRIDAAPKGPIRLSVGGAPIDIAPALKPGGWQTLRVMLKCFRDAGADVAKADAGVGIASDTVQKLTVADLRLDTDPAGAYCPAK